MVDLLITTIMVLVGYYLGFRLIKTIDGGKKHVEKKTVKKSTKTTKKPRQNRKSVPKGKKSTS